MNSQLVRRRSLGVCALLLVVATATSAAASPSPSGSVSPRSTSSEPAVRTVTTPDRLEAAARYRDTRVDAHRYSDPDYYPLRSSVYISCARTTCTVNDKPYHGDWEQDWTGDTTLPWDDPGQPGDADPFPVYAAGSGQVSIDRNSETCTEGSGESDAGTIVSIDHGGGVFSVYKHIDIEVADGEWVTPYTRIGTMASWGSNECKIAYLHMEVHKNGRNGRLIPFNDLIACGARDAVNTWPDDLTPYDDPLVDEPPTAYETWDDTTPYFDMDEPEKGNNKIPAGDNSCIPTSNATPNRPGTPNGSIGPTSISVRWGAPAVSVTETVLTLEIFRPSTKAWSLLGYTSLPPTTTSYTFPDLDEGRSYRVRIAHRNSVGASEWSTARVLMPGAPPDAPVAPRRISAKSTLINYAWYKSGSNAYPATAYVVAIRSFRKGAWTDWATTKVGLDLDTQWTGLRPRTDHQVRVRALSAVGPSRWSRTSSITTPAP